MIPKIGVVGIGQSPRDDLIPEIFDMCGRVELMESGALDGLSLEEIRRMAPKSGEYVLVTRLRDASSVRIAKKHIHPLVEMQIDRWIQKGADGILLLCTGDFPPLSCSKPILYPELLLTNFVKSVANKGKVGILTPDPLQVEQCVAKWHHNGIENVIVQPATPYGKLEGIRKAAEELKKRKVGLVVMDCMGYNCEMKKLVREIVGAPVVLPRTLAARSVAELFSAGK